MKAKDLIKEIKEFKDYDVSYEYIGRAPNCRCGCCTELQNDCLEKGMIEIDKKSKIIMLKTAG